MIRPARAGDVPAPRCWSHAALATGALLPTPGPSGAALASGAAASPDLEGLAVTAMAAFAVIGFGRGARREWVSLAGAVGAYYLVEQHWPAVARLLVRGLGPLGVGSPDPELQPAAVGVTGAQAGHATSALGAGAEIWQIAVFVAIVLAAYLLSQRIGRSTIGGFAALVRLPDLVDRLVGAALGAGTGYVAATFLLDRLMPSLHPSLTGADSLVSGAWGRVGPAGLFGLVALFILFGVLGLEHRSKRVFG